jgi:predicted ArsR family transcriptional regulator
MTAGTRVSRGRALAHDSRVAILGVLQGSAEALDASELADAVGLHVNTVRSHLGVLEQAELVARSTEPRSEPGRPRVLYTAAPPAVDESHRYRLMARMLASFISANVPDPAAASEETGRHWGRHLGPRPAPFARPTVAEGRQALLDLLDDLGFAPQLGADPSEVELRHCPFRDVAEAHPEVACSLHLGLMRGAMAQLEAPLSIDELHPFVDPDRCLARTSSAASEATE